MTKFELLGSNSLDIREGFGKKSTQKVNRRFILGGGVLERKGRFTFFGDFFTFVTCLSSVGITRFYTLLSDI